MSNSGIRWLEKTTESKNMLELERRRLLLEAANAAYAKMREDLIASKTFDDETKL